MKQLYTPIMLRGWYIPYPNNGATHEIACIDDATRDYDAFLESFGRGTTTREATMRQFENIENTLVAVSSTIEDRRNLRAFRGHMAGIINREVPWYDAQKEGVVEGFYFLSGVAPRSCFELELEARFEKTKFDN